MIFSVRDHVELIKRGLKTQTRRGSDRYEVGKTYAIQPRRGVKGIAEGRILILHKRHESFCMLITKDDAQAEGGYTPEEFEDLYETIHHVWLERWAYTFAFQEGASRCQE